MLIESAFAQDGATAGGMMGQLFGILPIILVFGVVYFLMLRPQMQESKRQAATIKGLKKGDKVVTVGGILGEISDVGEGIVTLRINSNDETVVLKDAVLRVMTDTEEKGFKKARGGK